MAGFNKDLILQGVRDELERATHTTDRKFDSTLAAWMQMRDDQRAARQRFAKTIEKAHQALTSKDDDRFRVAHESVEKIGRYSSSDSYIASQELPAMPQRKTSHRERALENVIKIVESHSEATVTIADLRALGVLEYVRVPKDVC